MIRADKDDTRIALINQNVDYIKGDISEIKSDIKALDGHYVSQAQFKEFADQLKSLSDSFKDYTNKQNGLQRFIAPIVSSALTGFIVFLVINFLQNAR